MDNLSIILVNELLAISNGDKLWRNDHIRIRSLVGYPINLISNKNKVISNNNNSSI